MRFIPLFKRRLKKVSRGFQLCFQSAAHTAVIVTGNCGNSAGRTAQHQNYQQDHIVGEPPGAYSRLFFHGSQAPHLYP